MVKLQDPKAYLKELEDQVNHIGRICRIDNAETGRRGKQLTISTSKRNIFIEIVYVQNHGLTWQPLYVLNKYWHEKYDQHPKHGEKHRQWKKVTNILRDIVISRGYKNQVSDNQKNYRFDFKNIDEILEIIDEIESMEELEDSFERSQSIQLFERRFDPEKIARRYYFAIENEDQDLLNTARDLLSADSYDKDIAINAPNDIRTYREHVVPCIYLHNTVAQMVYDGAKISEISTLIRNNLKIAYIDPEDANFIDNELGWKTTMPEGWNFGDSITARLDEAKIKY